MDYTSHYFRVMHNVAKFKSKNFKLVSIGDSLFSEILQRLLKLGFTVKMIDPPDLNNKDDQWDLDLVIIEEIETEDVRQLVIDCSSIRCPVIVASQSMNEEISPTVLDEIHPSRKKGISPTVLDEIHPSRKKGISPTELDELHPYKKKGISPRELDQIHPCAYKCLNIGKLLSVMVFNHE